MDSKNTQINQNKNKKESWYSLRKNLEYKAGALLATVIALGTLALGPGSTNNHIDEEVSTQTEPAITAPAPEALFETTASIPTSIAPEATPNTPTSDTDETKIGTALTITREDEQPQPAEYTDYIPEETSDEMGALIRQKQESWSNEADPSTAEGGNLQKQKEHDDKVEKGLKSVEETTDTIPGSGDMEGAGPDEDTDEGRRVYGNNTNKDIEQVTQA